jgi:transposase
MASIALERSDVIIGVDTHKREHVAVALDGLGGRLGEITVSTNNEGYAQLAAWASSFGSVHGYGVEGTGSYGMGLARFLRRRGERVIEVARPPRKGERRASGKSDPIDAEHAARQVLSGLATATPKLAEGPVEAIRLIKIARDTAVKAHSQAIIALRATLVTATDQIRKELEPLSEFKLVTACAALEVAADELADPGSAMRHVLASLAHRWLDLHEEIKTHTKALQRLTKAAAPELLAAFGIGFDSAAEMLVTFGDNTSRVRSEPAFAKLCGVCPIPASSGQTKRHRLNRGGNRQANAALYRIVIVRMRWHEPTKAYVERRITEGLTKKDIIRCLKRYVAREVYRLLGPGARRTEVPST